MEFNNNKMYFLQRGRANGKTFGQKVKNLVYDIYKNENEIEEKLIYDLYSLVSCKRLNYEFIKLINEVMNIKIECIKIECNESINNKSYKMYCDNVLIAEYRVIRCINEYSIIYSGSGVITTLEYDNNIYRYRRFADYSYKELNKYKKEIDNNFYRF